MLRVLSASTSTATSVVRRIGTQLITSAVSQVGLVQSKAAVLRLAVQGSPVCSLMRGVIKTLPPVVAQAWAGLAKTPKKPLTVSSSVSPTLLRSVAVSVRANVAGLGAFTSSRTATLLLAVRNYALMSMTRGVYTSVLGSAQTSATMAKGARRGVNAQGDTFARIGKKVGVGVRGSVGPVASLAYARTLSMLLAARLFLLPKMQMGVQKGLVANAPQFAFISKGRAYVLFLTASASSTARLAKQSAITTTSRAGAQASVVAQRVRLVLLTVQATPIVQMMTDGRIFLVKMFSDRGGKR